LRLPWINPSRIASCKVLVVRYAVKIVLIRYAMLVWSPFSCYAYLMTVTQTVEIPANHRLIVDVPHEIPTGKAILAFTPANHASETDVEECPVCAAHRDPITGEELFNAETVAAIEEGRAMMRGEIPSKRFSSFEEMWEDLNSEDPDD